MFRLLGDREETSMQVYKGQAQKYLESIEHDCASP